MAKIAVIRVRGKINISEQQQNTFARLNLHRQNFCTIIEDNSSNMGMIKKVKDFVTWGTIDDALLKELEKKAEKNVRKNQPKRFIRLNPPRKGYGRKGIKRTFAEGGALGPRMDKIGELIKRMI